MSVKVSVVLNLEKIRYEDFVFIESLRNQSLKDIEIIIISDFENSGDFDKCRNTLLLDKRVLIYNNFNELEENLQNVVAGEFVYFADSSLVLDSDTLAGIYQHATQENCDVLICDKQISKPVLEVQSAQKGTRAPKARLRETFQPRVKRGNLFTYVPLNISNYLFRTSFVLENSLFPKTTDTQTLSEFLLKALMTAERVGSSNFPVSYPINSCETEWKAIFSALDSIYNYIQEDEERAIFMPGFINCYAICIHTILQNCLIEPLHSDIISYVKEKINPVYKFLQYKSSFYISQDTYKTLSALFRRNVALHKKSKSLHEYKKIINIALPTSESLAPFTGVSIQSILDHASDEYFYNIYLLHDGLSYNSINRLSFIKYDNIKVNYVDLTRKNQELNIERKDMQKRISCLKMFIPTIFPNFEKIIYIDAYVQMRQDVAKYDNIDVKDKCIVRISKNEASDQNLDSVLIFNPSLCNEKMLTDKLYLLQETFGENFSFEKLQNTDIGKFCTNQILKEPEDPYLYIIRKSLKQRDSSQDFEWWQYARTTDFYEWILYTFFK